jgi:hypothetical protein
MRHRHTPQKGYTTVGVYLTGVHLNECASHGRVSHRRASHGCVSHRDTLHRRASHLGVFLARRTRVARVSVSTPKMFEASDCERLGRQAADHPWSALRVVKRCRKDCPTTKVLLEAKATALHPKRYQSSRPKLSKGEGWGGEKKRRQSDWLANQIDRQVIDRQVERQRSKQADEHWYPSRPCGVLNSGFLALSGQLGTWALFRVLVTRAAECLN